MPITAAPNFLTSGSRRSSEWASAVTELISTLPCASGTAASSASGVEESMHSGTSTTSCTAFTTCESIAGSSKPGIPALRSSTAAPGLDLGDRVGLDRGHVAGLHLLGEDRAAGGVDAFADDRERVLVADVDLATGTGQRGDRHRAHTATPTSFFAISTASGALFA